MIKRRSPPQRIKSLQLHFAGGRTKLIWAAHANQVRRPRNLIIGTTDTYTIMYIHMVCTHDPTTLMLTVTGKHDRGQ